MKPLWGSLSLKCEDESFLWAPARQLDADGLILDPTAAIFLSFASRCFFNAAASSLVPTSSRRLMDSFSSKLRVQYSPFCLWLGPAQRRDVTTHIRWKHSASLFMNNQSPPTFPLFLFSPRFLLLVPSWSVMQKVHGLTTAAHVTIAPTTNRHCGFLPVADWFLRGGATHSPAGSEGAV